MELIGAIVRLQVQRSSLKVGGKPRERYDPVALVVVPSLEVTADGAVGQSADRERILDVHNNTHPRTKSRGSNTLSVGFVSHYGKMRERFGPHLTNGIAGENFLVETARIWTLDDLAGGLMIVTVDGRRIALDAVRVAEPCDPFSRFALRFPTDAPASPDLTAALQFLRHGTRGFYATYHGPTAPITVGDALYRVQ